MEGWQEGLVDPFRTESALDEGSRRFDVGREETILIPVWNDRPQLCNDPFEDFAGAGRPAKLQPLSGGKQLDCKYCDDVLRHWPKPPSRVGGHANVVFHVSR